MDLVNQHNRQSDMIRAFLCREFMCFLRCDFHFQAQIRQQQYTAKWPKLVKIKQSQ